MADIKAPEQTNTDNTAKVEVDSDSFTLKCLNCSEMKEMINLYSSNNKSLLSDLEKLKRATKLFKDNEKKADNKIETDRVIIHDLKAKILCQQVTINSYLVEFDLQRKEYAEKESEILDLNRKFSNISTSALFVDQLIHDQKFTKSKGRIGYDSIPPPMNNNFAQMSEKDEILSFVPKTPFIAEVLAKKNKFVHFVPEGKFESGVCNDSEYKVKDLVTPNLLKADKSA
ncbi:MAG TPA: hypothetical protein VIJ14_03085, partial [Rhabdochlamydiaceae bacterium]